MSEGEKFTGRYLLHLIAAITAILAPALMTVYAVLAAFVPGGTSLLGPLNVALFSVLTLAAVLTFYFTMHRGPSRDELTQSEGAEHYVPSTER